jgi:hypothetical protein
VILTRLLRDLIRAGEKSRIIIFANGSVGVLPNHADSEESEDENSDMGKIEVCLKAV